MGNPKRVAIRTAVQASLSLNYLAVYLRPVTVSAQHLPADVTMTNTGYL